MHVNDIKTPVLVSLRRLSPAYAVKHVWWDARGFTKNLSKGTIVTVLCRSPNIDMYFMCLAGDELCHIHSFHFEPIVTGEL